jgi:ParB-like chromosome segregation protein Spo0J
MILDGHLRLRVFRELENSAIPCIVALDDEGFTYNKRGNRVATIQEHFMRVPRHRLGGAAGGGGR